MRTEIEFMNKDMVVT